MEPNRLDRFPHAAYRANRTVVRSRSEIDDADITVFVGLYNSDPYFDHVMQQIESQTAQRVRWLFVDNASTDSTWEHITRWAESTERSATVVRNGFNLGATGSYFVNFDLVTTEWVTFIHQDDIYLPGHVQTLIAAISSAPAGTVGVFSDLGRADPEGRAIGAFPPPSWMLPDFDPPTVFLALLRNHCIPWPALAVRTQEFRETEAPWHSTAFPDTEITLRLAGRGRFVHIPAETMRYRDSVTSESRSIDNRERKFGATVSLFRVFNSEEFELLAASIAVGDRAAFVTGLADSLTVRLGETDRARLVLAGALERLAELWDHSEPATLEKLNSLYSGLGATATSALLGRMASHAGGAANAEAIVPADSASTGDFPVSDSHQVNGLIRRAYERFGHRIPYSIRRTAARIVIRAVTRNDSLSPWRYDWR